MGLALGMALKFYNSVAKGLKQKARKFFWLVPTFVEFTGEKLLKEGILTPILNKVNDMTVIFFSKVYHCKVIKSLIVGMRHEKNKWNHRNIEKKEQNQQYLQYLVWQIY